jgi:3-oxoacyl-[acyl-carrier protein] reductase
MSVSPRVQYSDLAGRRALVTGGSSGIGLGIAEAFLAQGMHVAIQYRGHRAEAEALAARYPGRAVALQAELGSEAGCVALGRAALAALGGLEHLVHSAGVWGPGAIDTLGAADLEATFRLNTFAAFYLVRETVAALRAGAPGNILFIGSTAGRRGEAGHAHYAASKAALQALCQSLAVELAPAVRTNMISPGWVVTPMAGAALAERGKLIADILPNRRLGSVDDVAQAALWLASTASGHVLGENLDVSGGALLIVPRGQIQAR